MSLLLLAPFVVNATVLLTVNTTSSSNDGVCNAADCSLVEALDAATSALIVGDAVVVRITPPGPPPFIITAPSFSIVALNTLGCTLEIDGTQATGFSSSLGPVVELQATDPTGFALDISILGPVFLHGLALTGAPLAISDRDFGGVRVEDTRLGVGADGQARGSNRNGMELNAQNVTLRRVSVVGAVGHGILVGDATVFFAEDSVVSGNGLDGVHCDDSPSFTFTRCTFANNHGDGAELLGASAQLGFPNVTNITDSNFVGNTGNGLVLNLRQAFIARSTFLGNEVGLLTDSNLDVDDSSFGVSRDGLVANGNRSEGLLVASVDNRVELRVSTTRSSNNAVGMSVSGGAVLLLSESQIDDNLGDGLDITDSELNITDTSVDGNVAKGLSAVGGLLSAFATTFNGNNEGVRLSGTEVGRLERLETSGNTGGGFVASGVEVTSNVIMSVIADANGAEGLSLSGTVAGSGSFGATGGAGASTLDVSARGNRSTGVVLVFQGSLQVHGIAADNVGDGLDVTATDGAFGLTSFVATDNGGDGVFVGGSGSADLFEVVARGNTRHGVNIEIEPSPAQGSSALSLLTFLSLGDVEPGAGNHGSGLRCGAHAVVDAQDVDADGNGIGVEVADDCRLVALTSSSIGVSNAFGGNIGEGVLVHNQGRASVGADAFGESEGREFGTRGFTVIGFHDAGGIVVLDAGRVTVGSVQMFDNAGPAVDIRGDGHSFNDVGDTDGVLNYPYIESVRRESNATVIHGMVAAGSQVNFFLADRDAGDGQPVRLLGSDVEGGAGGFDTDSGVGSYNDPAWGADQNVARFAFRLAFSDTGPVGFDNTRLMATAQQGDRSSEMSPVFFTDPCALSLNADFCDRDNDGIDNRDEIARGTDPVRFDTDNDLRPDGEEGLIDSDGDGVIDALDPCVPDSTGFACVGPGAPPPPTGPPPPPPTSPPPGEVPPGSGDFDRDGLDFPDDVDDRDACNPDPQARVCDQDLDGLTNEDELRFGTDPRDPDSDADGLLDGSEARLDTDGDGINNATESNFDDVDHDGVPDALDAQVLLDQCRGKNVRRGGFSLLTAADVGALAGATCVIGDLRIQGPAGALSLPGLQVATGRIILVDTAVTALELGGLVHAGQILVRDNAELTELSLPALGGIDGDLALSNNPQLSAVGLSQLVGVGASLEVTNNNALVVLTAPLLTDVGGDLDISDNDALESILFQQVLRVGEDLIISDNDALIELLLSVVEAVGGDLFIGGNGQLESVDLTSLETVGGDLDIEDNAALDDVGLGSLSTVGGDLTVADVADDADIDLDDLDNVGGLIDPAVGDALPAGFSCSDQSCDAVCGDGTAINGEQCDDGNAVDDDGCSGCVIDAGFLCGGAPSLCATLDDIAARSPPDTTVPPSETCASTSTSSSLLALTLLVLLRRRRPSRGLTSGRGAAA